MNTKQLIKDFGRLLNDDRLGFCDVKHKANGVDIGRIVWADGTGNYKTLVRDLMVTYDDLIDCVRCVYGVHPTREMNDVLYAINYDNAKSVNSIAVTNSSNLELFNVVKRRMSKPLTRVIKDFINSSSCKTVSRDTTRYMRSCSVAATMLVKIDNW